MFDVVACGMHLGQTSFASPEWKSSVPGWEVVFGIRTSGSVVIEAIIGSWYLEFLRLLKDEGRNPAAAHDCGKGCTGNETQGIKEKYFFSFPGVPPNMTTLHAKTGKIQRRKSFSNHGERLPILTHSVVILSNPTMSQLVFAVDRTATEKVQRPNTGQFLGLGSNWLQTVILQGVASPAYHEALVKLTS